MAICSYHLLSRIFSVITVIDSGDLHHQQRFAMETRFCSLYFFPHHLVFRTFDADLHIPFAFFDLQPQT
ncbi:MAG: hypothetical protein LUQ36_09850 [Methanoregula sp.]|nr:hypothetical protein [Methanoregula sp.]